MRGREWYTEEQRSSEGSAVLMHGNCTHVAFISFPCSLLPVLFFNCFFQKLLLKKLVDLTKIKLEQKSSRTMRVPQDYFTLGLPCSLNDWSFGLRETQVTFSFIKYSTDEISFEY